MINQNLRIKLDASGNCFRRALVELQGDQSISWLRESPKVWKNVQSNINTRLQRGDIVDIIDVDGLTLSEGHRVTHALAGEVHLSKPLRLIELQESGLFSDDHFEVVPVGLAYSIRNKRSGHTEPKTFPNPDAARNAVLARVPA